MIGIGLAALIGLDSWILYGVAAFLVPAALIAWFRCKRAFIALLPVFVILGMISAALSLNRPDPLATFEGIRGTIAGEIIGPPKYQEDKLEVLIKIDSIETGEGRFQVPGRILLRIYPGYGQKLTVDFREGDKIKARGEIQRPSGRRNPGCFDYRAYLKRQGIYKIMTVYQRDTELLERGSPPWLGKLRMWSEEAMDSLIGGEEGKLLRSMLLGEDWLLSEEVQDDFSRTGLAHILAISGLHAVFILGLLDAVAKLFRLPSRWAFFFQLFVLVLYCLLVGAGPSIVRATIMAVVYLGGKLLGRKADSLNSLFLAAFLILLFRPLDLFDVGFQLSFGAVMGIILFYKGIRETLQFLPGWAASSLALTASAQIMVWPIVAYYFNHFSLISFLANLLLVSLSGVLISAGFLLLAVHALVPFIAGWIGWALKMMCGILMLANSWLSAWPLASVPVVSPSFLFLLCYYACFYLLSPEKPEWLHRPKLWCAGIAAGYLLWIFLFPLAFQNDLQVTFVDVGQGDCIFIRTPDEKNILIDAGGRPAASPGVFDTGEDVVVPFLLKNGINRIDLMVMSHAHDDHIGGLMGVLKNIPVKAFMEYPPSVPSRNYEELKKLITQKRIRIIRATAGQSYRIGRFVTVDVLFPDGSYIGEDEDDNNRSLVLLVRFEEASLLLTGDIEAEVEEYLSGKWNGKIDILKVAHHGSATSTTERWIQKLQPKLGVIQVGKNQFGHPHPDVLDRLKRHGVLIYRNDRDGAVICSYRNGAWAVGCMSP